jgi:hypothetical protein
MYCQDYYKVLSLNAKLLYLALVCLASLNVNAQMSMKPTVRAGLNISHFTQGNDPLFSEDDDLDAQDIDFQSKVDLYLGFAAELKMTKYYTLQPEINYSRQGSKVTYYEPGGVVYKHRTDVGYISIGVINKLTFGSKFNVHIGPSIDIVVDKNIGESERGFKQKSQTDIAVAVGMGYKFTQNIGIEGRIKKGFAPVIDSGDSNHNNVVLSIGATYTFDIKDLD